MANPDTLSQNLALARTNISRLLEGATPRLIDEWQIAPKFWDAVVHLRNGSYGLIEIKLGGAELINGGASSLKTLAGKIDTTKMKRPSFLMVLTGIGDYAYKRSEDGVLVVPVGSLKD